MAEIQGDRQGLFTEGSVQSPLFRQAWDSHIIKQGIYPSANSMVRFARIKGMQHSTEDFMSGSGHPICVLPGMGSKHGTKITIAIEDIRIAAANYDESARREPLGTTIRYGYGTVEIFYVDDAGIIPGSGNMQHDDLSRVKTAQNQIAQWHYSHVDECLRIPIIGRRGIGGNFFAFPYPEKENAQRKWEQPDEVKKFWRGENRLQEPSHQFFPNNRDGESSIVAGDRITARAIHGFSLYLSTMSAARQEFPVRDLNLAKQVARDIGGAGGGQAKRIMLISTEMANDLTKDNSQTDAYSYMNFHKELAGSNTPFSSIFWSNMLGSVGDTVLVREHKWTAHYNANGVLVQRAVVLGADAILMAFGTSPWEQISGVPKNVTVKHGKMLGALGRTWRMISSPINQGQSQKYYSSTYMGTKVNRLVHPTNEDEQDLSRAVMTVACESVRPDSEI